MLNFKPALMSISLIGLLFSVHASAEDAICNNVKGAIQSLSEKGGDILGVRATYQIHALDGFLYGSESGVVFNGNNADENSPQEAVPKIVDWGHGDILVVHPQESDAQKAAGQKNPVKFFAQYDEAPYNTENDIGTKGGMYKVDISDFDERGGHTGVLCSPDASAYSHHFFPKPDAAGVEQAPQKGDVFCVLDRKGTSYSLIRISNVCKDGLVFDHKFNGKDNFFATEFSKNRARAAKEAPASNSRASSLYGHH